MLVLFKFSAKQELSAVMFFSPIIHDEAGSSVYVFVALLLSRLSTVMPEPEQLRHNHITA
jgi:hypothetical protein